MANFPSRVLSHFAPFHVWLDELMGRSDFAFPEGGVTWRVDSSKRKSDLDKKILRSLKDKKLFCSPENISDINLMWSRFYWNAAGFCGSLQNLTRSEEWSKEEDKLTFSYLKTVEFVSTLFVSAHASGYLVSFEENPVGMEIYCVTLFGNRVLEHRVYWSID